MQPPTVVAFYLPHFYPTSEGSTWWGPGHTDWTTVAQARPLFSGHAQPHVPADLGFYDSRLAETRASQAALAARHGIGAFCYFHYWFNGRRLYEHTFEQVLKTKKPDFPLFLCWANQPWVRSWQGEGQQVLLKAEYSARDDDAHFKALLPAFLDPRYLKKDGRPVLCVQRTKDLPDPRSTARRWQALARSHGLPGLYLIRLESSDEETGEPEIIGFDAALEAHPEWSRLAAPGVRERWRKPMRKLGLTWPAAWRHNRMSYGAFVRDALQKPRAAYTRFPCVVPGWDDSPKRSWDGLILTDGQPKVYENWLREVVTREEPGFVFINAWNDWANGCHLEPCQRWGKAYLEATQAAVGSSHSAPVAPERTRIPVLKPNAAA